MQDKLKKVMTYFQINAEVASISPIGNGWINDSYKVVDVNNNAWVLQRINHNIFKDVDLLQNNISTVTKHIKKKLVAKGEKEIERKVLEIINTLDDKLYYKENNEYWRVYRFIKDANSLERVDQDSSYLAGLAFGDFQSSLIDLSKKLGETIPNFHNMEFRLEEFENAVKDDKVNRLETIPVLIKNIRDRAGKMSLAEELYREKKLPKRICHCDTKVNNIMFDSGGNILCVIDLDTVMPSFIFSDIGDFLRTAANTGEEDDTNLDNVSFNIEIFKAFISGYLISAKSFLTPIEIKMIPFAVSLFPYMQFVRFLTDYLNGDTYYKIHYPEHNLVRSKAQLKLLESVEANLERIQEVVDKLISNYMR